MARKRKAKAGPEDEETEANGSASITELLKSSRKLNLTGFQRIPALHPRAVWSSNIPDDDLEVKSREYRNSATIAIESRLAAQHRLLVANPSNRKIAIVEHLSGPGSGDVQNVLAWRIIHAIHPDQRDHLMALTVAAFRGDTTLIKRDDTAGTDLEEGEVDDHTLSRQLWTEYTRLVAQEMFSSNPSLSIGRPKGMPKSEWNDLIAEVAERGHDSSDFPSSHLSITDGEDAEWQYSPDHDPGHHTLIMVLGVPATLHLPTLGYSIPLAPFDLVGFQASKVLWKLERLREPSLVMTPMYVLTSWTAGVVNHSVKQTEAIMHPSPPATKGIEGLLTRQRPPIRIGFNNEPTGPPPLLPPSDPVPPSLRPDSADPTISVHAANSSPPEASSVQSLKRGANHMDTENEAGINDLTSKRTRRNDSDQSEDLLEESANHPQKRASAVRQAPPLDTDMTMETSTRNAGAVPEIIDMTGPDGSGPSTRRPTPKPTSIHHPVPVPSPEPSPVLVTPSVPTTHGGAYISQSGSNVQINTSEIPIDRPADDAYRISSSPAGVEVDEDLIGRFLVNAGYDFK